MPFGRKPPQRSALLPYRRLLVPLAGTGVDDAVLRVAALVLRDVEDGRTTLLHVMEIPFDKQLDIEDPAAVAHADDVLQRAQAFLEEHGISAQAGMVQARAAGPAIVDEAAEVGADLIVMGLAYKMRFGGEWDAGRTVPYVMRNATPPVWCLRAETRELAHTR